MGIMGIKCWKFLIKIEQENLREAPRFAKGLNTNAGSGGDGNPKNPENVGLGSKSRVVAKLESLDCLEKCLGWKHQTISSSLQDLLDVVPTTKSLGEICGADIQWLQGEKNGWKTISSWFGMPKIKGLSKCVDCKLMRVWTRVRGRFYKPLRFPWMKSEMNLGNGKMRWWKNTTVWSMKQRPLNLLTFPCWTKKQLSLFLENLWLFEKRVQMVAKRNVGQ